MCLSIEEADVRQLVLRGHSLERVITATGEVRAGTWIVADPMAMYPDVRAHVIRSQPVPGPVPALLGFIAGFVDICAFLGLFHIFVAQLTGSFVYAGAHMISGDHEWVAVLAIPAFFIAGCAAAALDWTLMSG